MTLECDFFESTCCLYCDFLAERRRPGDDHYSECILANQLASAEQRSSPGVKSTTSASVEKEKKAVKKTAKYS